MLSLHLKRFACDAGEAEARRVAQHVQLPPSLSLASYATPCCGQVCTWYAHGMHMLTTNADDGIPCAYLPPTPPTTYSLTYRLLTHCAQRDATYTLFGLVAHSGRSGCGHYTCYVQPCAAASQLDAALGASPPLQRPATPCNASQRLATPRNASQRLATPLTAPLAAPLQRPFQPLTASYRPLGASLPGGGFLRFDDEECVALSAEDLAAAFSPASRSSALACLCFYRLKEPGE